MIDYLIIGGGVIGTLIARELSHYEASVMLLEKEEHLAQIQTTHNSALVHSPVVIPPSSGYYKSKFALEGNRMYPDLIDAFAVPALSIGAYLLATDETELKEAKRMANEAKARGIDEVRVLSGDEMREVEPSISRYVLGGLDMPSAMTVDTYKLVTRVASNARMNGVNIQMGENVLSIDTHEDGTFTVHTEAGNAYDTKNIINAAGIKNAHIANMVEEHVPYTMKPRLGEYFVLRSEETNPVSRKILFPVPTKISKGVLVTPQPNGTLRIGPSARNQVSLDDNEVSDEGLEEIKEDASHLMHSIPYKETLYTYAGIRSTINLKDFYIKPSLENSHFIHVAGIDSPGVTSAPAIAKYVVEALILKRSNLNRKEHIDFYSYEQ